MKSGCLFSLPLSVSVREEYEFIHRERELKKHHITLYIEEYLFGFWWIVNSLHALTEAFITSFSNQNKYEEAQH